MAMINYPDCSTYSGDKILVYLETEEELRRTEELYPHFLEGPGIYPVARFLSSESGMKNATSYCFLLTV